MQNQSNAFDRFIDHFSLRDLKIRVRAVIVAGIIMCIAAVICAWFLLPRSFVVADTPDLQSVPYMKLILSKPHHAP